MRDLACLNPLSQKYFSLSLPMQRFLQFRPILGQKDTDGQMRLFIYGRNSSKRSLNVFFRNLCQSQKARLILIYLGIKGRIFEGIIKENGSERSKRYNADNHHHFHHHHQHFCSQPPRWPLNDLYFWAFMSLYSCLSQQIG